MVPGSTLDHVVFFADDGTAYTMRINEVPATTGYGEPITKFFKLGDQVKIVAAVTTDPRFTPADQPAKGDTPGGPFVLVGTTQRLRPAHAADRVPRRVHEGRPALCEAGRGRQGGVGALSRRTKTA